MTVALIILTSLGVVLTVLCGWLFGKVSRQTLDIEKLYDAVATLANDDAKLRKQIAAVNDLNRDQYGQLLEKVNKAAQSQEEAAEAIAREVEKKWDSGLQNMMAWNPFDRGESEGR